MARMHEENARQDNMLRLEVTKRLHGMTMDTNNMLVAIDPFNNQLKYENNEGTTDDEGRHMQQQGMEAKAHTQQCHVRLGG